MRGITADVTMKFAVAFIVFMVLDKKLGVTDSIANALPGFQSAA